MRLLIVAVTVSVLWAFVASAFTVDQYNDSMIAGGYHSIPSYTPIGQEFRPQFDHIDVAEMYVTYVGFTGEWSELVVDVHAGDISNPPLSTSDVVGVVGDYTGPVLFTFPGSVPLTPGEIYVLIIRELHGVNWGMRATEDLYPSGQMIKLGEPVSYSDAWFREGSLSSPVSRDTWAGIKSLYRD